MGFAAEAKKKEAAVTQNETHSKACFQQNVLH